MKAYFYPQSTYTSILAFSELFNDLTVRVYDKNNKIIGIKPVPLSLTPKEKIAAILSSSTINDVDPQIDNYLPRISVNMDGLTFDTERMRGKYERRLLNIEYDLETNTKSMQVDVQSIPYNINFEVTIWTKYMTDGMQLIEYLVPDFAPEKYVSFKERNFGIEHKSKVTLNSVSPNFVFDLNEKDKRVITWTLSFSMESIMFKPMEILKEILCANIKIANVMCKKVPLQGSKIVAYEPASNDHESVSTKSTNLSVYNLDASEEYDLMIKYWQHANTVMNPSTYASCVDFSCSDDIVPKPTWDPTLTLTTCGQNKKLPCITVDTSSGNITNYWQEETVDPDNIIRILSYKRIYDNSGNTIFGPELVDNSEYPTSCEPIYSAPISGYTPPPSTVPPSTTPPSTGTDGIIEDPCDPSPDYNTTG